MGKKGFFGQAIFFLIALFSVFPLWGEESIELSFPETEVYDILFTELKSSKLSGENRYLGSSIPLLIRQGLEDIGEHLLSDPEKEAIKKNVIRKKIAEERKTLISLLNQKDGVFFGDKSAAQKQEQIRDLDAKLSEARDQMARLKEGSIIKVTVGDSLATEMKLNNEILYEGTDFSMYQYARKKKADLVVYGLIEEIHQYIYIEIRIYNSFLEKDTFVYRTTADAGNIYGSIDEIVTGMAGVLLGRPWSSLLIKPGFPGARILVDREARGFGDVFLKYASPGELTVTAVYPGNIRKEQQITLEEGKSALVEFPYEEPEFDRVTLNSEPAGANLYINSTWKGQTPLELEVRPDYLEGLLKKEGFNDFRIDLQGRRRWSFTLIENTINPVENQKEARERFYTAFGFFLLSIPIDGFLYNFSSDFKKGADWAFNQGNASLYTEYWWKNQITYGTFWGGVAVSSGLLIYTAFTFYDYITASDALL